MKNHYSTLFAIAALVGLFTAGRVEAGPNLTDLQNQHNAQQTEHTQLQNQHTGQTSQHTNLQNQLNAIQSQLEQIPPAWSQDLPAAERFVLVLGGAAVLDKETGLGWEQSPDATARSWLSAQAFCNTRSVGGRKGWGLPTIQQLASLVDPTQSNPALPAGHPFSNVQASFYWSATSSASVASFAWGVYLSVADVNLDVKTNTGFVWCVRGGHGGPDAQ